MHPSLLTHSMVNDLLARACQNKEKDQQVEPMLFLVNDSKDLRILPLLDLAADADARRAQFYALGRQFPDTREAVFICETWFVTADRTVDAFKVAPSDHPSRQEAIILAGRNRSNTQSIAIVKPFFMIEQDLFWLTSIRSTTPGSTPSPIDLIFAP